MKNIHQFNAIQTIDQQVEAHFDLHSTINTNEFPQIHDFYEFSLVLKGELLLTINEKQIILEENQVLFIQPGEIHDKYQEPDCLHLNLAFSTGLMDSLFDYLNISHLQKSITDSFFSVPQTLNSQLITNIKHNLDELSLLPFDNTIQKKAIVRLILVEILTKHYLTLVDDMFFHNTSKTTIPWFNQLLIDVNKKEIFTEGPSIFPELCGKNQSYICRIFKRELGISPSEYCNQLRLNYAANLIIHSDYEIIDIAYESGFQSLSHFYSLFQKFYHMTPKNFRSHSSDEALHTSSV